MEYLYQGLRRSVFEVESLRQSLVRTLELPEVDAVSVEREALDARHKAAIVYDYNLCFTVSKPSERLQTLLARGTVAPYVPQPLVAEPPTLRWSSEPVIIGFGPAGMFLGLELARKGYRPLIFERGQPVEQRARDVARLWREGELDPESNLQFGAGGAGTWSDGKLSTGKSSPLDRQILETLVAAGAPERILFSSKPHIGTDYLQRVVAELAGQIEALGGRVHFGQRLEQLQVRDGQVTGATIAGQQIAAEQVVLAIGHSARDTVTMLHEAGVAMEPKPFAVGTRIEHPASLINEAQYGAEAAKVLPAADYRLTFRDRGQAVYSFCMCPGGQVVCASSEAGAQVSNGMSRYARDGRYSNSALVVGIDPARLGLGSPLQVISWQRELERRAFAAGGGGYCAPAQRASDFLRDRASTQLPDTSYQPGVMPADLEQVLPSFVTKALRAALQRFNQMMPGFVVQGVLIGMESRTSSPVRLLRDDTCQSASTAGLYLLGEGAGYAGGIMTCARDAVRLAQQVVPR
jgi:hypothetical protein